MISLRFILSSGMLDRGILMWISFLMISASKNVFFPNSFFSQPGNFRAAFPDVSGNYSGKLYHSSCIIMIHCCNFTRLIPSSKSNFLEQLRLEDALTNRDVTLRANSIKRQGELSLCSTKGWDCAEWAGLKLGQVRQVFLRQGSLAAGHHSLTQFSVTSATCILNSWLCSDLTNFVSINNCKWSRQYHFDTRKQLIA